MGAERVAGHFGVLRRYDGSGRAVGEYRFDPAGPISNAWLARCGEEGVFPAAGEWRVYGRKGFVTFGRGWILHAPKVDDWTNWRWIDLATGGGGG